MRGAEMLAFGIEIKVAGYEAGSVRGHVNCGMRQMRLASSEAGIVYGIEIVAANRNAQNLWRHPSQICYRAPVISRKIAMTNKIIVEAGGSLGRSRPEGRYIDDC